MLNLVLVLLAVGVFGYGSWADERSWLITGACLFGVCLISIVAFFFFNRASVRCPLCMVPLWGSQKCQRNTKVKPALGVSYRLGVANSVIFRGHYRCPYCGEPFSAREARKSKIRSVT